MAKRGSAWARMRGQARVAGRKTVAVVLALSLSCWQTPARAWAEDEPATPLVAAEEVVAGAAAESSAARVSEADSPDAGSQGDALASGEESALAATLETPEPRAADSADVESLEQGPVSSVDPVETVTAVQQPGAAPAADGETSADAPVEHDAAANPADAANAAEDPEVVSASEAADATDEPDADSADEEAEEEPEPEEAALPSGELANGWTWKLVSTATPSEPTEPTDSDAAPATPAVPEGPYTLAFEYAGDSSAGVPALNIAANFAAREELAAYIAQITNLSLPEGVASIGARAFANLAALQQVAFPRTLVSIGDNAFEGCASLARADFSAISNQEISYPQGTGSSAAPTPTFDLGQRAFAGTGLASVSLPDNLNAIGSYAFANCPNLRTADLPALSYLRNAPGTYLFSNDTALQDLSFRAVEGRVHYNSVERGYLPEGTLNGCTALRTLDFSGYEGYLAISNRVFSPNRDQQQLFPNNDITNLEQVILPKVAPGSSATVRLYGGSQAPNLGSFANKPNFTDLDVIKNPQSVYSIGANAFNGAGLVAADLSAWTGLTAINSNAFANNANLGSVVLPENLTSLGASAFRNDPQLKTVTVNSKQLTGVSNKDIFEGSAQVETVTIGATAKKLNGNFLAAVPSTADVKFQGENVISISRSTLGGLNPLKNLDGTYYVDARGVLYKLASDGTASLAYVPAGLQGYTVPASITTPESAQLPAGTAYDVTKVEPFAVNLADDLIELVFDDPSQVKLSPNAFTGWTTMLDNKGNTINGRPSIYPADWAFASVLCNFPINEDPTRLVPNIVTTITNTDGKDVLRAEVYVLQRQPSEDGTYDLKTGQTAKFGIDISNDDNLVKDKVVRVYFAYDGTNYHLGQFPVGDTTLEDGGRQYPLSVVETETPGIYYYDVAGVEEGQTLSFQNGVLYESPNSAGGSLRIWVHILDPETAQQQAGKVLNPGDYLQLDWSTDPVTYKLKKNSSSVYDSTSRSYQSAKLQGTAAGDLVVRNLAYIIKEDNQGSPALSEGLDFIRWVQYEDVLTLPQELHWREGVLDAIAAGNWKVSDTSFHTAYSTGDRSGKLLQVTVGGSTYNLAYLYSPGVPQSGLKDLTPTVVTEDGQRKVKLSWYVNNSTLDTSTGSATSEYPVQEFYLRVGDSVLLADPESLDVLMRQVDEQGNRVLPHVDNYVHETRHYSYSDDQQAQAQAQAPVRADAGLTVQKDWNTSPSSKRTVYGGQDDFSTISFTNTGVLTLDLWGNPVYETDEDGKPVKDANNKQVVARDADNREVWDGNILRDPLPYYFYIEPDNLQVMLDHTATVGSGAYAQQWPVGDWLTVQIARATLATRGQYQVVEGTEQEKKFTTGDDSNLYARADNGARNYENAAITLSKNPETGLVDIVVQGDAEDGTYTLTAGAGGQYASIAAAFDAIGYMPTHNTTYTLLYHTDDFYLKAGQTLRIPVRSTAKTTPMLNERDSRWGYQDSASTSYVFYTSNTAYYGAKVGDQTLVNSSASVQTNHRWARDLFINKSAYLQGGSSKLTGSVITIEEGSVIDYEVFGRNRSGKAYDTMQFSDFMDGAQVVLVPVEQNPGLKDPHGNVLDTLETGGASYWVLNVPGTYADVVLGGPSRSAAQSYKATVQVSATDVDGKRTSLNTLIDWEPFANWGVGSAANSGSYDRPTYIYYKSIVSAWRAGMVSADSFDEGASYRLNNKAWLGDHQGHRLWDVAGVEYQVFGFDKWIVGPEGKADGTDSRDDGTLVEYSRLKPADVVTYQIDIYNYTSTPAVITGNRIYDRLPDTCDLFDWTRGDSENGIEANVYNLRYVAGDDVTLTVGSGDSAVTLPTDGSAVPAEQDAYWRIEKGNAGSSKSESGTYRIVWDNSFRAQFQGHGVLHVLVDVAFPERPAEGESVWDQYVAALKGGSLWNYFYLDGRYDFVEHTLESEGKAVLYKGVYDTGLTTHTSSPYTYSARYTSNKSRLEYSNGVIGQYSDRDLKAATVTYYTVLYNGSYDRLYLSDLQDQLPRGFRFNSMANTTTVNSDLTNSYLGNAYVGYTGAGDRSSVATEYATSSETSKLVRVDNSSDELDENDVRYVNAQVTAATAMGSDGRQHITFKVAQPNGNYTRSGYASVHYDGKVGKYYLNPGEALRFGYNVQVGRYADTDDVATNTIAMPYYDYYDTGFVLDVPTADHGGAVQYAPDKGVAANDGTCTMMDAATVASRYGMSTAAYGDAKYNGLETGNWMVSDVTVKRGEVIPGIQKTVGGSTMVKSNPSATTVEGSQGSDARLFGEAYSGGLRTDSVVNWRVRLYNESGSGDDEVVTAMSDYTVTDTVDEPYAFTGQVFYNSYVASGSSGLRTTYESQYLFTIGTRKSGDTSVRFGAGGTLSSSYRQVTIGSAEDDSDDDWYRFGSGSKAGSAKLERTAAGKEVLTVHFEGPAYDLPGAMWMELAYHTMYNADVKPILAAKYNEAVLRPVQDYDAGRVAQGRARTVSETDASGSAVTRNDGVQSGASVMLTLGYTTESWKRITELENTSNTASSEESRNYITLGEKCRAFRYDVYVVGPQAAMSSFTLIDDLPHPGDHSAFVEADLRYSDFNVAFLEDNPQFQVAIAPKRGGAETVLDPSQYTLSVSSKHEFTDADWAGGADGWTVVEPGMDAGTLASVLADAESLRVVITDDSAFMPDTSRSLMREKCQVRISFNARIDDPQASPGQIAWNSFGYRYQVPRNNNGTVNHNAVSTLQAQPLNVGVRYPASPSVQKLIVAETQAYEEVVDYVTLPVMVEALDDEGNPVLDEDGKPVMVEQTEPVLDEEGNPVLDEDGNAVVRTVTTSERTVSLQPAWRPVVDAETGEALLDEDGNPVMEPVMEKTAHPAAADLQFGFLVYEGEALEQLDDALSMDVAEIAAALDGAGRAYLYVSLDIAAGETASAVDGLWTRDYADAYDALSGTFATATAERDALDADGNPVKETYPVAWHWVDGASYTVVELPLGDYDYSLVSTKVGKRLLDANNVTFVNGIAQVVSLVGTNEWTPDYVDVCVSKAWDDADDQDGIRPESVTVHLLADGEPVDDAVLSAENDWSATFAHLLARQETGEHIAYSIEEDAVEGYESSIAAAEDDEYAITVTNVHVPGTVAVSVVKEWDDFDDYDEIRPQSVTVRLFADGEDTGLSLELSAAGAWQGSFANLPAMRAGQPIEYTVEEDPVEGYESQVLGNAVDGFTVFNTHEVPGGPMTPQSEGDPEFDDEDEPPVPQSPDEPVTDETPGPNPTPGSAQPTPDRTIPRVPTPQTGDRLPVAAASLMAGASALAAAAAWLFMRRRRQQAAAEAGASQEPDVH